MAFTPKQYIDVTRDVLSALDKDLIDQVTGQFKKQPDFKDDTAFIADVLAAYQANGGVISPEVEKAVAGVVAALQIFGVFK